MIVGRFSAEEEQRQGAQVGTFLSAGEVCVQTPAAFTRTKVIGMNA